MDCDERTIRVYIVIDPTHTRGTDILAGTIVGDSDPWWKHLTGAVHSAGTLLLSAFGLGNVAKTLGDLEASAGILPGWAGGAPSAPGTQAESAPMPDALLLQPEPTLPSQPPKGKYSAAARQLSTARAAQLAKLYALRKGAVTVSGFEPEAVARWATEWQEI